LQFYPASERSGRSKFTDAVELNDFKAPQEEWVEDVLTDLIAPDSAGLRSFMRNIGGDIDSGREAFQPLCRLHLELRRFTRVPEAMNRAIELLDLSTLQAGTVRAVVTTEVIKQPRLDDAALDSYSETLNWLMRSHWRNMA